MNILQRFFASDAAGGIIMLAAAALAMLVANSSLYPLYHAGLEHGFTFGFTAADGTPVFALQKPLLLWINDLLMALFFLYAGLEIKRELFAGALSSVRRATLPLVAALCGMAGPALVYLFINRAHPEFHHGWAIPAATDIAFALGVLALASSRVPSSVKVLLMAIAVMDDLGAILVIAFFYTSGLFLPALAVVAVAVASLAALNALKVTAYGPYFIVGFVLWVALLKAGVHPTIGGVILGFSIPMRGADGRFCALEHLEHMLKPWVVFLILPVFAFANAGVPLAGLGLDAVLHPVTLGIALGLFIGKAVGVFGATWLSIATGLCPRPDRASSIQLFGMACLCGIGFTMALFVGGLAFNAPEMAAYIRMGVIGGSLLSGVLGYGILCVAAPRSYKGLSK